MADYEELIGAKVTFSGFDEAYAQYDQFIRTLSEKGKELQLGVNGGAFEGVSKQLEDVKAQVSGLAGLFKDVFGTGADAAQESAQSIKQSVTEAESAFISAQTKQTESAQTQSAKRIEIAQSEANAIRRTQEELKAKSQVTSNVSFAGRQILQQELQKIEAERQARLKAPTKDQLSGAQQYGSSVAQKELDRIHAEQQARLKAPTRDPLQGARAYGSDLVANEIKKLEDAKANSGIGGFFKGIGTGLAPQGDSSAASIGEFVGQAARFVGAYAAIRAAAEAAGAAIKAPFEIIKGGIEYLSEFQERASQLKTTLLDHGFFSKDPAENLAQAGQAADALQSKVDDLATKLHVKSQTIQAAFETFSGFGGNALTGNLGDSVQLAGIATGALQSQNPVIQQRTVATQLQKLTTGTLKDTDKLPAALGISAEKLNEMAKGAATTHDLLQQIEADAPGLADRIGNANDRFASLVDSAKLFGERLEGIIAKPTFDLLTEKLKELLKYLDDNKDSINGFASSLGTALAALVAQIGTAAQALEGGFGTALKNVIYNVTTLVEGLGHVGNSIGRVVSFFKNGGATGDYKAQQADSDRYDKLDSQLHQNSETARSALFDAHPFTAPKTDPTKGYTNTTKPAPAKQTGNTSSDQIAAIRNSYSEQVAEVKKQSAAIRSAIEEDAKNFRVSLIDAADLKEAAYQEETDKVTAAGEKAKTALAKVIAGKDPAKTQNAKNSVLKAINENNLGVGLDSDKSKTAGQDAIDKQSDAIDATNRAASQERATALLNADYAYKQELQKKGVFSDSQALDNEQSYWDKLYKIRLKGIQDSVDAEKKDSLGDPKKLAELNKQREAALTDQSIQNQRLQRQRNDLPYTERQRQFGLQEERDQADVLGATNKTDIDRHAGLTDLAKPDNTALLRAQRQALQTEQDQAVDTLQKMRQDVLKANPAFSPEQLASNPAIQAAQNKVTTINAALVKTDSFIADSFNQGKSTQEASDSLFGQAGENGHFQGTDKDGNSSLYGTVGQTVSSLGNAAKVVQGGVGAVESGYQQGGAGGAVGAGLAQIGALIPGIGGQIVGGIGSIISTVSALFTQAAQEIGKQVGLAVDKAMAKYSEGQATLSQTLTTVQQQYATLVSKETGKKGGQQVLDTEGLQLQQQIDQLKQQQQQTVNNFADQTIVSGGTNSVAQQWLQTWISVNKQVQQYENAVGNAAAVQLANQYLNEQLDQERKSLQDQYIQGQSSAVNDALQLNQLLQQRNNYEDQYRQQVFSLQSSDSLARRGNPAEETARQITLAKSQYNQQTQQLNFEIDTYQQKVAYEQQIFGLATTTAALQKQALTDQAYQLNEQVQQYQTIVALLASITGVTAVNGQIPGLSQLGITLPTNYGVNDGSLNPIPGYGAPGTTDNSVTNVYLTIPAGVLPSTGTPQDFATAIGNELAYRVRTGSATAL